MVVGFYGICTAVTFSGLLPCLHGMGGECHGEGVLLPKLPFIIVHKTKEKGKRDIYMPDNGNKQKSRLMRERRAK